MLRSKLEPSLGTTDVTRGRQVYENSKHDFGNPHNEDGNKILSKTLRSVTSIQLSKMMSRNDKVDD